MQIGVLRGGPSAEYDVSLKTGEYALSLLRQMPDKYKPVDILISKEGDWYVAGTKKKPKDALKHIDVVFNALHGAYGEDGGVQKILSALRIPYTGSKAFGAALSMNKDLAKEAYVLNDLLTPRHTLLYGNVSLDNLIHVFRTYLPPVIVKPSNSGSSVGIKLAHTFEELKEVVALALKHSDKVMVEEFIKGKEGTCGVVENARGEKLYALIPVEIQKPKGKNIFDYDSKYSGKTTEICPGTFSAEENKKIEYMAKRAHEVLGLRHYSRSDFIITPKGRVYILETNSLPGLTQESLLPKSLKAVGWKPQEFVEHLITQAYKTAR
jgi:D-alanine-D-alanine ligase